MKIKNNNDQYIEKWERNIDDLYYIIKYISSYNELSTRLQGIKYLTKEELYMNQNNWLNLLNQLSNKKDIDFFKPYWVWCSTEKTSIFFDLSNNYQIFQTYYHWIEPYMWIKRFLYRNINDLLLSPDCNNIIIDKELKSNKIEFELFLNKCTEAEKN